MAQCTRWSWKLHWQWISQDLCQCLKVEINPMFESRNQFNIQVLQWSHSSMMSASLELHFHLPPSSSHALFPWWQSFDFISDICCYFFCTDFFSSTLSISCSFDVFLKASILSINNISSCWIFSWSIFLCFSCSLVTSRLRNNQLVKWTQRRFRSWIIFHWPPAHHLPASPRFPPRSGDIWTFTSLNFKSKSGKLSSAHLAVDTLGAAEGGSNVSNDAENFDRLYKQLMLNRQEIYLDESVFLDLMLREMVTKYFAPSVNVVFLPGLRSEKQCGDARHDAAKEAAEDSRLLEALKCGTLY